MATETQQILDELQVIKGELQFIKRHMPDRDMFLTAEEKQLLEESYAHEREGKLISSEELSEQLGL